MMTEERPNCLGFHEPDNVCDGNVKTGEPPCAWRGRCLTLISLCGGKPATEAEGGEELIANKLEEISDADLDAYTAVPAARSRASKAPGGPTPAPDPAPAPAPPFPPGGPGGPRGAKATTGDSRPRKVRKLHDEAKDGVKMAIQIYHPPVERHGAVLTLIEDFTKRFSFELGRALLVEGTGIFPGDLFVRYTPGMGGRLAHFYEATKGGRRRHRLLTRFQMLVRRPQFNLKTGIPADKLDEAIDLSPPAGLECLAWKDTKPHVALVGVDAGSVRDAALWLVRCYNDGLIDQPYVRKTKT